MQDIEPACGTTFIDFAGNSPALMQPADLKQELATVNASISDLNAQLKDANDKLRGAGHEEKEDLRKQLAHLQIWLDEAQQQKTQLLRAVAGRQRLCIEHSATRKAHVQP